MENLEEKYSYLKLLSRPLDPQQLKVCCRTDNTVVAAGAGSGKTQVLATRFAWLVMEHEEITAPSILTLTFTKKAAAEMYSRIYETLRFFAYDCGNKIPEFQRKNAERALSEFANVHIQTLDSYCGGIVRQAANRYGIRPDFSTGTADAKNIVKQLALPFVLQNKNNPGILYYSDAGKLQDFAEDFFADIISKETSLATPQNYFVNSLKLQSQEIINAWNTHISKINEAVHSISDSFNEIKDDLKKDPQKYEKDFGSLDRALLETMPELNPISDLDCIFNQNEALLSYINSVMDYVLLWDEVKVNGRLAVAKPLNETLKLFQAEVVNLFISLNGFIKDFPYTKEVCILLDKFLLQVQSNKRTSGALEFSDVTEMALKILIEQKDIRHQEKEAFSKIMIDEFQDNNGKNRDLLFLLSEISEDADLVYDENNPEALHQILKDRIVTDKLFFVGDEKQSIYKFRGADVSVFNELKNDLKAINGEGSYLQMIYNYRSDPELLTSFNTLFGGYGIENNNYTEESVNAIFLPESKDAFEALYPYTAIARFVDKVSHKELTPVALSAQNVKTHIKYFVSDKNFKRDENNGLVISEKNQIAYSMAKEIAELHNRGVDYSAIAVLDRSRGDRKYLVNWLERFNVPYNLDQQAELFSDGPVNDIYNFLRLCVYPSDVRAFAAFICSPFAGLQEQNMETILSLSLDYKSYDNNFKAFEKPIEEKLAEYFGIDSVEYERYLKAKDFFTLNQPRVLSQPLTKTLNFLWYEAGYRYETLLNESVNSFEEQYDLLFELGHEADDSGYGVSWFIDELAVQKSNEASIYGSEDTDLDTKEVSYPLERNDAVNIMTIHKSKGLQFDYVFALGCLSSVKKDSSQKFYADEKFGLTFKTTDGSGNYFFNRIKEIADKKAEAEFRRLIYVAATRAIKELYLFGKAGITAEGKIDGHSKGLFTPIIDYFYPDFISGDSHYDYVIGAPFDIAKLDVIPSTVYSEADNKVDIDDLRHAKIEAAKVWMENIKTVTCPELESNRISPSSMELEYDEEVNSKLWEQQENKNDLCPEVDGIILEIQKNNKRFGFNDYGTLVHYYLQLKAVGFEDTKINSLVKDTVSKLKPLHQEKLLQSCKEICDRFYKTNAGLKIIEAKNAGRIVKAEEAFKSYRKGKIITGAIDLYMENSDGTFTIIDYKTDHVINPEVYVEQQLCYKQAVCDMYNLESEKVNCLLYYLRYNSLVNVG